MIYDWQDLAGIREQILANVSFAFPLISGHGITPTAHTNGNPYNVIVSSLEQDSDGAVVIYGPSNRVFAVGGGGKTDRDALLTLLEASDALVGKLYDESKLPMLNEEDRKSIVQKAVYEPGAGC